MRFVFDKDSWLEVRDRDNKVVFSTVWWRRNRWCPATARCRWSSAAPRACGFLARSTRRSGTATKGDVSTLVLK